MGGWKAVAVLRGIGYDENINQRIGLMRHIDGILQ